MSLVSKKDSDSPERQLEMSHSSDKEEDSNEECIEEGVEIVLSHIEEKTVIGLNKTKLTNRLSQGNEGQLLKVVKEEEGNAKDYKQQSDEVLVRCQREIELLEEQEYESVITVKNEGVSQALIETEICVSCQVSDILEEKVDEYAVRKMTDNLLLESKIEDKKQQMSCAEGDVSKDTKDVWENEECSQQLENESIE